MKEILHRSLVGAPRNVKRAIMATADLAVLPLALWAAFALRFGTLTPDVGAFSWLFLAVPLTTVPIFCFLGLYRTVLRYMGTRVITTIAVGTLISVLLLVVLSTMGNVRDLPRSVVILYGLVALVLVSTTRFALRAFLQEVLRENPYKEFAIIYGAGAAGLQAALALEAGSEFQPVAFVDDAEMQQGDEIHGLRVYSPKDIGALIERFHASAVLLALPSVPQSRRREIVASLEAYRAHIKTLPALSELLSGKAYGDEMREVPIEDILGRDTVPPHAHLLSACIRGKTVLVTGAGGSIGSELCRQIVRLRPAQLLLYEFSEFNLYRVERELRGLMANETNPPQLVPMLGNVSDPRPLREALETFGVHTAYHAAAYKHVPLVEQNIITGVRNNVFGTLYCAEAAIAAGVETFVLVSTDKAVRPTNVMGATKRLAELVVQGLAEEHPETRLSIVRFGNVLDSSGSVVPLFREQIRHGGPVTVTDPDVTRYFMTIPEASELVIQAGAITCGSEVFVLDMGEPVGILQLAKRLIHLHGLEVRDEHSPQGDIEIKFTGLRPGEKLYEELLIGDKVVPTEHPMIMRAVEGSRNWRELTDIIERLERACASYDHGVIRQILAECVSGYCTYGKIVDFLWQGQSGTATTLEDAAPLQAASAARRGSAHRA